MSNRIDTSILNIKNYKDWVSSWYTNQKEYFCILQEDIMLYLYIRSKLRYFLINSITSLKLTRIRNLVIIIIANKRKTRNFALGKSKVFKKIVFLRKNLLFTFLINISKFFKKDLFLSTSKVLTSYNVLNAFTIAFKVAKLIERRIRFRSRLVKKLVKATKKGYKGIYIECKGRINNVDMARSVSMYFGSVPFQSLSCIIDHGFAVANTVKGLQSVKVWVQK